MVSEPNLSTATMSNDASSSSFLSGLSLQHGSVTEKLGRDNYPLWKAQVMPPLRSHQLVGFLDGTVDAPPKTITVEMENKTGEKVPQDVPNTAYTAWVSQDQQVLGFLLSFLSREVLTQVAALTTAAYV
jgi:hypothetical protein